MKTTIVILLLLLFSVNRTYALNTGEINGDTLTGYNHPNNFVSLKSANNGSAFLVDSTYTYMYPFSPDSVLRYKQRYAYDKQLNLVLE